jgi:hypothetical protein
VACSLITTVHCVSHAKTQAWQLCVFAFPQLKAVTSWSPRDLLTGGFYIAGKSTSREEWLQHVLLQVTDRRPKCHSASLVPLVKEIGDSLIATYNTVGRILGYLTLVQFMSHTVEWYGNITMAGRHVRIYNMAEAYFGTSKDRLTNANQISVKVVWWSGSDLKQTSPRCKFTALSIYQLSCYWDANSSSAIQKTPWILCEPMIHNHTHNRPSPVPILSQTNRVHVPTIFLENPFQYPHIYA